mmetsp:Transcript_27180/g.87826  ORF Transcript_27180/g.87826 Transcript_27180/m.87826 type:complete len:254 (+) Transcript_27180:276-1037(+)
MVRSNSSISSALFRSLWLGCASASATAALRSSFMFIFPPQLMSSFATIFFHLTGFAPPDGCWSSRSRFGSLFFSSASAAGLSILSLFATLLTPLAVPLASPAPFSPSFALPTEDWSGGGTTHTALTASSTPFSPFFAFFALGIWAAARLGWATGAGAEVVGVAIAGSGVVRFSVSSMSSHSFSAMPSRSAFRFREFFAKLMNLAFLRGKLSYCVSLSMYDLSPACLGSADSRRLRTFSVQLCCFLSPFFSFGT